MGLETLAKPNGGLGLTKYWKDIFPSRLSKLHVYKGVNLNNIKGNSFSKEDELSITYLTKIAEVEGIFGGVSYSLNPQAIEKDKAIKELELRNIPVKNFTCFIEDLKFDFEDPNLFYTLDEEFVGKDINEVDQKVFSSISTNPNVFASLLSGVNDLTQDMISVGEKRTISFVLSPSIYQNTLPSSKVSFLNSAVYQPLPTDAKEFEITSIEIESDHTFMPEYGNWIKATGKIDGQEEDIDLKMDKPLLPIRITPYAKKQKLEFIIRNFVKYYNMPWLYAKHFLGNDRSIKSYIEQGNTQAYATELTVAIIDMFKMAHAFNTNFKEYRDQTTGELSNDVVGGVSLKGLESKSGKQLDTTTAITQVLKNWEYKYPDKKKTPEFLRSIQLLTASSEWVSSEYSFGGVLSEAHKVELDFFLNLDTNISKTTTDISMTLDSIRYEFDVSDTANPKIKGLKPNSSSSNVLISETDRIVSLPEIDDPISLTDFSSKPADFNLKTLNMYKYFVGLDITDPAKIEKFFIDSETSTEKVETISTTVDSIWYSENIPKTSDLNKYEFNNVPLVDGIPIETNFESLQDVIKKSTTIPKNAYDIVIKSFGSTSTTSGWGQITYQEYDRASTNLNWLYVRSGFYNGDLKRVTGAVIEYKIKTVTHGVENKIFSYDKAKLNSMVIPYVDDKSKFKRTLTISDFFIDPNGDQTVKIQSINKLMFSFVLGNYVDIKILYKHKNDSDAIVTGAVKLPRINLPSINDETRTKFGIKF